MIENIANGAFALMGVTVNGFSALIPVGNRDLTDPTGPEDTSPQPELPIWPSGDVIDTFSASDSPYLRGIGASLSGALAKPYDKPEMDMASLAATLRDLCEDDIAVLRARSSIGTLRFSDTSPVGKKARLSIFPADFPAREKLDGLIRQAGVAHTHEDFATEALIRARIIHQLNVHPEMVQARHTSGLLNLALEGHQPELMRTALDRWVVSDPVGKAATHFKSEDIPQVIRLAKESSNTILRAFCGEWTSGNSTWHEANEAALKLFTSEHLFDLFGLMECNDAVASAVTYLAYERPDIFRPDHIAYLSILAPYKSWRTIRGGREERVNKFEDILWPLRKAHPGEFPQKAHWWSRNPSALVMPKSRGEAEEMAKNIRAGGDGVTPGTPGNGTTVETRAIG